VHLGFQHNASSFLPVSGHFMYISFSHYLQILFNLTSISVFLIYALLAVTIFGTF
jgi:hypothetical protein